MKNIGLSENPGLSACAGQFYPRAKLIFKRLHTHKSLSLCLSHTMSAMHRVRQAVPFKCHLF